MDLVNFQNWLMTKKRKDGNPYRSPAIATRIRDLKIDEKMLGDIDECVKSEEAMYKALLVLKKSDNLTHAPLQTALRRYWEFKYGSDFPKLCDYERARAQK